MTRAFCLLLLAAAALAAAPGSADVSFPTWSQFLASSAHVGEAPHERTLRLTSVRRPGLEQAWSAHTGGAIDSGPVAGPYIRGGAKTIFVGSDDGILHAYRPDGSEAWSTQLSDGSTLVATPAVAGPVLVFTSSGMLEAFDPATGGRFWSLRISDVQGLLPAAPTVAGGLVYAVPYELVAVDVASHEIRWVRRNASCFGCSPAVREGILYIGMGPAAGRQLLALDAQTGKTIWSRKPTFTGDFEWSASASVADGRVFIAGWSSPTRAAKVKHYSLYAFDAKSGKRLWKAPAGSSRYLTASSPAIARGAVIFASPAGRLYAVRIRDGKRLWSTRIPLTYSSPAIANGAIFLGAGKAIAAFSAKTGRRLWSSATGGDVNSSPAVEGGAVYVGSDDGVMHAYRLRAG